MIALLSRIVARTRRRVHSPSARRYSGDKIFGNRKPAFIVHHPREAFREALMMI
jgi:hypothetical protein